MVTDQVYNGVSLGPSQVVYIVLKSPKSNSSFNFLTNMSKC